MRPNYNCSQDELYTGEELCINSFEEDLALFADEKPKYNSAYVLALRAELQAARDLPDMTQRDSANKARRIILMRKIKAPEEALEAAIGEKNFGRLRSYINTAYSGDKALRDARLNEAGFDEFEKVLSYNWEKVVSFLHKSKQFLSLYEADLLAGDNMPTTFKAAYDTMATGLMADVATFLNEQENVEQMTQEKLMANSALHKKMNELRADGQNIFRKNAAKRDQFVWSKILEEVTPPGAAGLRGTVKDGTTFLSISGAVIEMQLPETPVVVFETDANGGFYSGNLPVGVYSFKLYKTGYATIETEVEIKVGTTSYKHFKMTAGGGTVYEAEGNLVMGAIGNIDIEGLDNPDADVVLEVMGAPMNFFASNSPMGGAMGGVITVAMGVPVELKASVLISTIGLTAANSFFNVQNVGVANGGWKVRVSVG